MKRLMKKICKSVRTLIQQITLKILAVKNRIGRRYSWLDIRQLELPKALWIPVVAILCLLVTVAEGAFIAVESTNPGHPKSLHNAIMEANTTLGPDFIMFAIPGPGPHTFNITAANPLPPITERVAIMGYTQTGASPNTNPWDTGTSDLGTNAVLMIEIDGNAAGPNAIGLHIKADECHISGLAVNNFNNAASVGILLDGVSGTQIHGNFIGVDVFGSVSAGNETGVKILDAPDNYVGGTDPLTRNLIAAGGANSAFTGVLITGQASTGNTIQGNQFGTDMDGLQPLPGFARGFAIQIDRASGNLIGGTLFKERNVIGNHDIGVFILRGHENQIFRNYIGVNLNAEIDPAVDHIPNDQGIRISKGSDNEIGGDVGAVIAYNDRGIVVVESQIQPALRNTITQNSITRNDELGIDLEDDDVTFNDWFFDFDTGPNELQNFPIIVSAKKKFGPYYPHVEVTGYLFSAPNSSYRVELFSNPECDPVFLHGEGEDYLTTIAYVTTNFLGYGTFTATAGNPDAGAFITATATTLDGSTSEFSPCGEVTWGLDIDLGDREVVPIGPHYWEFLAYIVNNSEQTVRNVTAILEPVNDWLIVEDDNSFYGDIPAGGSVQGDPFVLDLTEWPGGSFLVILNVTYENEQGTETYNDRMLVELEPEALSGVPGPGQKHPDLFSLKNFPNPANPGTTISFDMPMAEHVSLQIYDARGKLVRTLVDENLQPGSHAYLWDGKDNHGATVASGIYSYRLEAGRFSEGKKLLILK